jgi:hypothetical protein
MHGGAKSGQDLTSTSVTTMSLPILTLPHLINPSLALSTLSDLLPRLNHSHPAIRKKTIVTLYRLALVYPETLRPAWPKIKDRLMDEGEDPSVTAAIVNVVCELGWRRPQDFLPLAPRLFELLVDSGNNWMAIKLIKLVRTHKTRYPDIMLTFIVCNFDAIGAKVGSEVITPSDVHYSNYTRYVAFVRVHKRDHSGRNSG